ncbi:vault poly [Trichoderma arundinaceum]|uniref:Vault poly n=1 Tax=Trichoderma arundinaceum TaxID=490622 RepID=A0A395NCR9_TRIAR|nr:vault poly [Trichoderma arundinaceum]
MFQRQHPYSPNRLPTCGVYIIDNDIKFLPLISLDAHTSIISSTSRTVLTQNFVNPKIGSSLKNVRYVFPLYDGVSVAGFKCTIGSRVIHGVVKERQEAKQAFNDAVAQGKTAGLLEQSLEASDVFTTSLGNIPSGENVKVEITYLGELKHDAQVDGLRFTIPTSLAHRYGSHSIAGFESFQGGKHINITIDVDVSSSSSIKSIQSPSHPISVNIGTLSTATSAPPSLQRAYATLSQGSAELDKDFIIQIVATGLGDPMAVLETHPTIPNQRALMTTLVPRFNMPMEMSEVVFMCDRSGSMGDGRKILRVIDALKIFLKSLPVGVKFNICSFGSTFSFLWDRSMTYDQATLDQAIGHVSAFDSNLGGTEMYQPMQEIFKRRYQDMNLEVFLLTDGEIWQQEELFQLVNKQVSETKGAIRIFTLGVGKDASHALIEGVARAGNGFAQTVGENEKMDKMLVRMLKGALTPHITDYTLEIKYEGGEAEAAEEEDDDFEIIEKVMDAMTLEVTPPSEATKEITTESPPKTISLFDQNVQDKDMEVSNTSGSPRVNLPSVPVPRYLQAPFQIPPLFPFSRTTVYILLSDSTPNRQPKSVILKGTSSYGPLSLEIPVATLTEKGTTVHQLAARKAVGELEEGRGWIFHVKNEEGKLLQQQFDGQFGDMVKKEAVRLGTQYQVSGKWCSFVAIQDADSTSNDQQGEEQDEEEEEVDEFDELPDQDHSTPAAGPRRSARISAAMPSARQQSMAASSALAKKSKKVNSHALQDYQAQHQLLQVQQAARLRQMRAAQYATSQGIPFSLQGHPMGCAPPMPASSQPQVLQHTMTSTQPNATVLDKKRRLMALKQQRQQSQMQGQRQSQQQMVQSLIDIQPNRLAGSMGAPQPNAALQDHQLQLMVLEQQNKNRKMMQPLMGGAGTPSGGLFGSSGASQPNGMAPTGQSAPAGGTTMKREAPPEIGTPKRAKSNDLGPFESALALSSLSSLQTFAGYWQFNSRLENILGFTSQRTLEKVQLPGQYNGYMEVLATLCAVVFLKKKLADEKDTWELFVQKAEDWLRNQTGEDVQELESIVEDAMFVRKAD